MLEKIILSIVQAITELLPISSSGHLIIVSEILKYPIDQLLMTFLHFWTALAILVYYSKHILELLKSKEGIKTLLYIGLATIPAAIMGVIFDEMIEALLYTILVVGINSIFWGSMMILIEKSYELIKLPKFTLTPLKQYLIIGTAQVLALIPGTSRSGVTTLTGMFIGKSKAEAIDTAFLLGIPITLGPFIIATIKMIIKKDSTIVKFFNMEMLIAGLVTFIFGLLSIKLLVWIRDRKFLTGFGIYRIILGLILCIFGIFFL